MLFHNTSDSLRRQFKHFHLTSPLAVTPSPHGSNPLTLPSPPRGRRIFAFAWRGPHANVTFNGRNDGRVSGTVFEVTDTELAAADRYEQPAAYKRIAATLASGKRAWVYLHAREA